LGAGNIETIRKFAAELVALKPAVILVSGGTAAGPLLQLTRTVPVLFTQTPDPISSSGR
jgi:putative tryptophan/tyrosine transport system substrate-binding protein